MAFHIRSPDADKLARELQAVTGESLTEAVTRALEERLAREREAARLKSVDPLAVLRETWKRLEGVGVRDSRPMNEIPGYGDDRLPH